MAQLDLQDDFQGQLADIRRAQAEIDRRFEEQLRLRTEGRLIRSQGESFPVSRIFQVMIAGAALLTGGAVIAKMLISH